jgi:hypothetical protein
MAGPSKVRTGHSTDYSTEHSTEHRIDVFSLLLQYYLTAYMLVVQRLGFTTHLTAMQASAEQQQFH